MRGDEDGATAIALFGDEGEELLLHQRVEAAGRLVEDQQLGLVEGGEDQADLLAIAAGELPERPVEVGPEASGEGIGAADSLDPSQACQQPQRLAASGLAPVAEVARQVAEPSADRDAVAATVEAEEAGAAPARMQEVEQGADRRRLAGPFGPRKPNTSPASTEKVTSSIPRALP
jgi:hypothetical protein